MQPGTSDDDLGAAGELAAGTILGDWRIDDKIGEGGMGTVYAAVHHQIGKRAAIKVVRAGRCRSPVIGERFMQEARVVNQISHPNIVDIFHVGRIEDGRPYLVMELLHGCTLADRLAEHRMPALDAIEVLLEIAAAISAAHAVGVVHRDLKPGNIFLADGPAGHQTVKVVDWGIAKLVGAQAAIGITNTGVMLGTPLYVSPEQARGRELDARSDIYSLGVIAYEMFSGDPPFVADNVADLLSMHLHGTPAMLGEVWTEIPPALERLVRAMLAKAPDGRPTLAEVIATLESVRVGLDGRMPSASRRRLAAGSCPPADAAIVIEELDDVITSRNEAPAPIVDDLSGGIDDSIEVILTPMDAPARWPWLIAGMVVAGLAAAAIVSSGGDAAAVPPAASLPTATLDVQITPAAARVLIDGAEVPSTRGRVLRAVAPGAHEIRVEAPGYASYARSIEVDGTIVLDVVLARAAP